MTRFSAAVRISGFYGALFLGLGIMLPFLPLWLAARGLSVPEIALVLAVQSVVRAVSAPVTAYLADRSGERQRVILLCALVSLAGIAALPLVSSLSLILLAVAIAYAAWGPILPLIEAYTVQLAESHALDYGRLRLWGSLSFIAGSLSAGAALEFVATQNVVYLLVGAHALLIAAAWLLPKAPHGNRTEAQNAEVRLPAALKAVCTWSFAVIVIATGLSQSSHAVYYAFGSVHWERIGYGATLIGMLWSVGVIAEVCLFAFSGRTKSLLGPLGLILLGALGGALRWAATATDPGVGWLFGLQALHGLSFGATHLGVIFFIYATVDRRYTATAQGIYAAVSGGLMMTLAVAAAGPLYAAYQGTAYGFMAGLSVLAGLLAGLLWLVSPKARAAGGA